MAMAQLLVVDGRSWHVDRGGPEALVQLALAFYQLCKSCARVLRVSPPFPSRPLARRLLGEYPQANSIRHIKLADLQRGDVLVIPEISHWGTVAAECDPSLVARGVHVVVYFLSTRALSKTSSYIRDGCHIIAHTHYLAQVAVARLPSQQHQQQQQAMVPVIRPYISPSLVSHCRRAYFDRTAKPTAVSAISQLVLVDSDAAGAEFISQLEQACRGTASQSRPTASVCDIRVVSRLPRSNVTALLSRARVVFDWCLVGAERLPIEAVLCGATMITSRCLHGGTQVDFPLGRELVLNETHQIAPLLTRLLRHEQVTRQGMDDGDGPLSSNRLRELYLRTINSTSMAREARDAVRYVLG